MDGGWDQRASGKAYNNSASGHHVSVGGWTNKVCALVYYSEQCSKCEKGKPHPDGLCANRNNYAKSSRAMESLVAVKTVLNSWDTRTNAYVSTIVTGEESTTRSKLSHPMADRVSTGRMVEAKRWYKPKIVGRLGAKINKEWQKEVIDKQNGNAYFNQPHDGSNPCGPIVVGDAKFKGSTSQQWKDGRRGRLSILQSMQKLWTSAKIQQVVSEEQEERVL
jgi:hypothetical protein